MAASNAKVKKPAPNLADDIAALKLRMQALENRLDRAGSSPLYLDKDQALLRDARKLAGWSMRDVAAALGVSANLVMWWAPKTKPRRRFRPLEKERAQ